MLRPFLRLGCFADGHAYHLLASVPRQEVFRDLVVALAAAVAASVECYPAAGSDVDHKLENFEDTIIMLRNVPAALDLDIAVFVSSILVNILGESTLRFAQTLTRFYAVVLVMY